MKESAGRGEAGRQQKLRPPPKALHRASAAQLTRAKILAFDIDGTITTQGKLGAKAYSALWDAHHAGLGLVAVTGRPAGWCDHFARMWPINAVVGENGAFYFAPSAEGGIQRVYAIEEEERARTRAALLRAGKLAMELTPGTRLAADQAFRLCDLAIDFAEDVGPFDDAVAYRVAKLLRAEGATAKVSNIHVNAWVGRYNKRGMLMRLLRERFGLSARAAREQVVYAGDSPNDAPLFAAVDFSVGVANCRRFLSRLSTPPRYLTRGEEGEGFAELVAALLGAR